MLPITTCTWAKVGFCEWGLRKVLDSGKSKMVTKWVPNGSICIISPSFCISRRDLSHGGLPEAKNQLSKFGCAIWGYKKKPCGNGHCMDRTCKKNQKFSEMGRRGSESHFEPSFVEEISRSSDLNPFQTDKNAPENKKMRFFPANFC